MFSLKAEGSYNKTEKFLAKLARDDIFSKLSDYGQQGVNALSAATPYRTGETSSDWSYEVISKRGEHTISWKNSHMAGGVPLVILLQYGHGTGTGGYVQGRDFINPAMRPVMDQIANDVWKAVTSA